MEDPMVLQDLARECLVGSQIGIGEDMEMDMEMAMEGFMLHTPYSLSSSSSECNSSTATRANSSPSKILSFDTRNTINDNNNDHHPNTQPTNYETIVEVEPRPESEPGPEYPLRVKKQKRKAEQCHNHIIAERERRRNLSQGFIALSALVPGLKKMDKTSILGEAINHMKQLKERLKMLEELPDRENGRRSRVESGVVVKIMVPENHIKSSSPTSSSSSSVNHQNQNHDDDDEDEQVPEIEARFSDKNVLIKIQCQKQKGILTKIVSQIENLHLSVNTTNAMPFDDTNFDITILAMMDPEFDLSPQAVVQSICSVFK